MNKSELKYRLITKLESLGFSYREAMALRKIEKALHRWHEQEANGDIERNEVDDKPKRYTRLTGGSYTSHPIRDLEKGALKRLALIMKGKEGLVQYIQPDCRGCALYIVKTSDVEGVPIEEAYTRGVAISS